MTEETSSITNLKHKPQMSHPYMSEDAPNNQVCHPVKERSIPKGDSRQQQVCHCTIQKHSQLHHQGEFQQHRSQCITEIMMQQTLITYISWNNFPLPGVQCAGHQHCLYSLIWFLPAPHPQSDWSSVVGALHYRQPAPADTVYIKCFHSELNNYLIKSLQLKVHTDLKCKQHGTTVTLVQLLCSLN